MKKNFKWRRTPVLVMATAGIVLSSIVMVLAGQNEPQEEVTPLPIIYTETADLNVYVNGELSTNLSMRDIVCGETVTLTAPAEGVWYLDPEYNTVASYQSRYTLAVNSDTSLYFKNEYRYNRDAINFTSKVTAKYGDDKAIRLTATYSLDPEKSATEAGIRYIDNRMYGFHPEDGNLLDTDSRYEISKLLGDDDPTYYDNRRVAVSSGEVSGSVGDWTLSFTPQSEDDYLYAIAYVKVDDSYLYSDIIAVKYSDLTMDRRLNANVSEPFQLSE
ncbi:MAG: hypothetical protein K6G65_08815 [Lachnospiraceae bacterium]|nr:hypothetical protein [Lachnospiraceae bacterium]